MSTICYDVAIVKAKSNGHWRDILKDVGGVPVELLDGDLHQCPKCKSEDGFRLTDIWKGSIICAECARSGTADGFLALGWLMGWAFANSIHEVARYLGIPPSATETNTTKNFQASGDRFKQPYDGRLSDALLLRKLYADGASKERLFRLEFTKTVETLTEMVCMLFRERFGSRANDMCGPAVLDQCIKGLAEIRGLPDDNARWGMDAEMKDGSGI